MKPRNEGAAWDLEPDKYEMVNEPGGERSEFYQADHHHPEFWPHMVMGFDLCGCAKPVNAIDQPAPEMPVEARQDDMRVKDTPMPNYDRVPGYPAQQVVDHDSFTYTELGPRRK